jgi:hypothetical protein
MERELWIRLSCWIERSPAAPLSRRFRFRAGDILTVYGWACVHDRPVFWACQPQNWPADLRPARLPSPATMSRRRRDPRVVAQLARALRRLRHGQRRGLLAALDGKPLPVSPHSADPDARWGRGAGGRAKGYKLHVITGRNQRLEAWEVQPMNVDERVVAHRLLAQTRLPGYLLADRNYDANHLYDACRARGVQLLAPRRYGPDKGLGRHRHSPARLHAVELLERSHTGFGPALLAQRPFVERFFGQLSSVPYGLSALPAWVRRQHRVELWVQMKLLLFGLAQRRRARVW